MRLTLTALRRQRIKNAFYQDGDVVKTAKELIGKLLVTNFNNRLTVGRIVETEAYNGIIDKASHAFGGRRTNRTEVMFGNGGTAYVYLCYGIHHLFNVVTNSKDVPHAILIRAVEPVSGLETMLLRTGKAKLDCTITRGPGNVSKALGIKTQHSGVSLQSDELFIANDGFLYTDSQVISSLRIGVDYAGEDALLPYRFSVTGNKYVSGKTVMPK